jgi:hypothetical protein
VLKTYTRPAALKSRITKWIWVAREQNTNIVNFSR